MEVNHIFITIISSITAIISAILGYFAVIRAAKIKKQLSHPITKTNLMVNLTVFSRIREEVYDLFLHTTADRFLILVAHNGKEVLRFCSVIYEQHNKGIDGVNLSFGAVSKYVRFEFDEEYRKMLKKAEINGMEEIHTDKLPKCDLREIYKAEGILHSNCYIFNRIINYDNKGNDLLFYGTVAKHTKEPFSFQEKIITKVKIDKLKYIIKDIG